MGLFSSKASKTNQSARRGTRAGRKNRARPAGRTPQMLEPLEGRQMYSVTPAMAIASEYAATRYETDAYGTNVQALIGSATSGVVNDPYVAGAQMQTYHDGGAIYYSPATGAHLVMGGIGGEYAALAKETDAYGRNVQSIVGLPTSDEQNLAGFAGARTNTFQWGAIDWSPSTGAHVLYGGIGDEYASLAHPSDPNDDPQLQQYIGLPTSDEAPLAGVAQARVTNFQGGSVVWSPTTGAHVVYGGIGATWENLGGAQSFLGMPTSDEYGSPSDRIVTYQEGYITWTASGATVHESAVGVNIRYGDELVVTDSGLRDSVSVTQNGSTLIVTADGNTIYDYNIPTDGLYIYTRGGTDSINVDGSVTVATTVETIDAAPTTIVCNDPGATVWCDSTDAVYDPNPNAVQRVASYAYGTSKAAGASLPDPKDSGTTFRPNLSLFGTGPVASDINQGAVGDCYFMATLASVAQEHPEKIRDSVVDMGDGTYVVEMWNGNTPNFDRVSDDMPVNKWGGYDFASPGPDDTLWGAVMEKAFCEFRSGSNTYASISGGEPGEVFDKLHLGWNDVVPSNNSDNTLFARLSADMANHRAAVFCTVGSISSSNELTKYGLVGDHCYSLVGVEIVNGVHEYLVRNPWGVSGDSLENGNGIATLTYKQFCQNFNDGADMK